MLIILISLLIHIKKASVHLFLGKKKKNKKLSSSCLPANLTQLAVDGKTEEY